MWDLPGPGLEPVSPALAGGFLTTAPPGKSLLSFLLLVSTLVPDIGSSFISFSLAIVLGSPRRYEFLLIQQVYLVCIP